MNPLDTYDGIKRKITGFNRKEEAKRRTQNVLQSFERV